MKKKKLFELNSCVLKVSNLQNFDLPYQFGFYHGSFVHAASIRHDGQGRVFSVCRVGLVAMMSFYSNSWHGHHVAAMVVIVGVPVVLHSLL